MPERPAAEGADTLPGPVGSVALIANGAFSLHNFRGPLIAAMVAAGVRVHALAPDYDEASRTAIRALGAEPVEFSLDRTGMHPMRDLADMVRLARLLRRLGPDATFGYFIKPVIYGSLAAWLARVPRRYALVAGLGYVYTPTGRDPLRRRLLRGLVSMLYRIAFKACDRVFFQNPDDIAEFVDAGILPPGKARLLSGTGVDLDRFAAAPPVEAPPTFLLVARLLREKGICEYVEAARIVRRAHPQALFLLAGGLDPNPGGLGEAEVSGWVAEGAIDWLGVLDDVRPAIAKAGIFVLPSYREGKPRSTQEAMAMARPVVTTDVPGCRATVEEGVNGFLVPPRDAGALARAMIRFIEEPALIARMGKESRRLAEDRFDVHRINGVILGELGIVARPPPPGGLPERQTG